MGQTITFFPEGNAECVFLELDNGKRMLMDYANMHSSDSRYTGLTESLKDIDTFDVDMTQRTAKPLNLHGFSGSLQFVFPYIFPLQFHNVSDESLHAGGAVLFHAVSNVPVFVKGKSGGSVAQTELDRLDILPGSDGVHGVGMPLWHNKDKSDKPLRRNGLSDLSLFFFH